MAPNLLKRRFKANQPNVVWVSDITYLWTRQGWMYLAVIIDLFSRKVVGRSIRERMTAELICGALDAAVAQRRPPPGLLFQSDRGLSVLTNFDGSLSENSEGQKGRSSKG